MLKWQKLNNGFDNHKLLVPLVALSSIWLLFSFSVCHSKLNLFGFLTVDLTKQDIWEHHLRLWDMVKDFFFISCNLNIQMPLLVFPLRLLKSSFPTVPESLIYTVYYMVPALIEAQIPWGEVHFSTIFCHTNKQVKCSLELGNTDRFQNDMNTLAKEVYKINRLTKKEAQNNSEIACDDNN